MWTDFRDATLESPMYIIVLITLAGVLVFQYWTTKRIKQMERTIARTRDRLIEAKTKHQEAQDKRKVSEAEETRSEERVRDMKILIEDLGMRVSAKKKEDVLVDGGKAGMKW